VSQKVSHYQVIKKSKLVNAVRFIRQIKVWITHYNIIRCMPDLLYDLNNYAWPAN